MLKEDDLMDSASEGNSMKNLDGNNNNAKTLRKKKSFLSKGSGYITTLGYSSIPKEKMDSSRDYIKNWLNFNVLANNIQNFPETIIEYNGE